MMADKESVEPAMDQLDQPAHSVDYYYLEAMRYLTCKAAHHSDDSDNEDRGDDHECSCSRCRMRQVNSNNTSNDGGEDGKDSGGTRERSWSHSMAKDRESDRMPELPIIDGKFVGGRLRNRRYSDGMLLKTPLKVTDGHVHWADECKKELTRYRPRKKYSRSPSITQAPVKSILKNGSEESVIADDISFLSDSSTDD